MYQSPARRRPLSAINNNKATTHGSLNSPAAGSGASSSSPKSVGLPRSTSKASLEISREGRASLSFCSFEPYRLPTSTSSTVGSELSTQTDLRACTKRSRARTISGVAPLTPASASPAVSRLRSTAAAQLRSPASIGPTRRVRSKTLSRSQNQLQLHERQKNHPDLQDQSNKRCSLSRLEADDLNKCLRQSSEIAEEDQLRLMSTFQSLPANGGPSSHVTHEPPIMLSAPSMQRSSASPGYAPLVANSTFEAQRVIAQPLDLPEEVEQLSAMITELQIFLPQASSVSSAKLQSLRSAVDAILKPASVSKGLEEAIKLDDYNSGSTFFRGDNKSSDPFYINWPSTLGNSGNSSISSASDFDESMYFTPLLQDDAELNDVKYSMSKLQQDIQDLELRWDSSQLTRCPTTFVKDEEPMICPPRW